MNEPTWIVQAVVVAVHRLLIAEHGGSNGLRDPALLESALFRPKQRCSYAADSSLFDLAAAYAFGLARNHPFVDGNKRVALTLSAMFLEINGWTLDAPEAEAVVVFDRLAAGELSESELADWLRESSICAA